MFIFVNKIFTNEFCVKVMCPVSGDLWTRFLSL